MRFLVPLWRGKARAHILTAAGSDTLCRMLSTGGLEPERYVPTVSLGKCQLCRLCERVYGADRSLAERAVAEEPNLDVIASTVAAPPRPNDGGYFGFATYTIKRAGVNHECDLCGKLIRADGGRKGGQLHAEITAYLDGTATSSRRCWPCFELTRGDYKPSRQQRKRAKAYRRREAGS